MLQLPRDAVIGSAGRGGPPPSLPSTTCPGPWWATAPWSPRQDLLDVTVSGDHPDF